jgi:hypothetical protein
VTVGVGYGYLRSPGRRGGAPVLLVGAERRVSRGTTLLTENYISDGTTMLMGGARFIHGRGGLDLGLVVHAQSGTKAPLIRWTIRFGSAPERRAAL